MKLPSVSIVGTGSLGTALALALHQKGFPIKSLFNRSPQKAKELAAQVGSGLWGAFPDGKTSLGELVFITVSDSSIGAVAEQLAEIGEELSQTIAVHCSGTEPSASLGPLKQKGAAVAAFHPLQTFSNPAGPADFEGIYFNVEGDETAKESLRKVAGLLGAHIFDIGPEAKPRLHAAAVLASNYIVALLSAAGRLAEQGGIDREVVYKALMPLTQKALDNVKEKGPAAALTGPVARGDISTINKHLLLLGGDEDLVDLYIALGKEALKLAGDKHALSPEVSEELNRILYPHE